MKEYTPKPTSSEQLLLNLNDATTRKLQEQIAAADGTVRVIVHPFHHEYYPEVIEKYNQEIKQKFEQYKLALNKLLENTAHPIIIFEEEQRIASTAKHALSENCYFIATEVKQSQPTQVDWQSLGEIFKSLGIEKVIIGGQLLGVGFEAQETMYNRLLDQRRKRSAGGISRPYSPQKCVGTAAQEIAKQGIEIDYSGIALPQNRTTIHQFEQGVTKKKKQQWFQKAFGWIIRREKRAPHQ